MAYIKTLSSINYNANGIHKLLNELQEFVNETNAHTQTRSTNYTDNLWFPKTEKMDKGGGVAIYINHIMDFHKNVHNYTTIPNLGYPNLRHTMFAPSITNRTNMY